MLPPFREKEDEDNDDDDASPSEWGNDEMTPQRNDNNQKKTTPGLVDNVDPNLASSFTWIAL